MPLGVCYYPEHWPESSWASDARKMRAAGLQFVRIGEFAWALMEPAAGQYDWGWLDRALAALGGAGLKVVLGTPTATPPAWLTAAEPELLRVGADGRRLGHGGRRQACLANGRYHDLSRGIVAAMAERYGDHPAVAAWQIDNELGNHGSARCFCPECRRAFQGWLREKYGSLAALNQEWGAVFWSQTYGDWAQIPLPADPVGGGHNPSLLLDYRRWASGVQVAYCRMQAAILRERSPARPLLTNIAPGDDEIDWFDLAAEVDSIAWDNYPHGFPDWQAVALFHDHVRGLKRQPFWVMEQQPGPINWTRTNPPVPPGQVRLWSYQDAAHGAENVLYFRWRACRLGQEQYHSGLLDHAGRPARGYGEAGGVAAEWDRLGQPVAAPRTAALIVSYADLWAQQIDPHAQGWDFWRLAQVIHRSLTDHGIGVDVVRRGADLAGYELAVA
ncbi:MAG TPA: beta-galactosidase, partial [Herpetosiphonaceae bacterium]|nr:beta-galactosidase [Herpetosiphonaceae bacterium]